MFPTLSVTLIGLLLGVGVMLVTKSDWTTALVGLIGAWVGFSIGALVGVVLDIIFATGLWVALVGHVLAVVGAALAIRLQVARVASTKR
jgi:hypothetical protein